MVFQPKILEHGLEWIADGYKHRLFAAGEYREPEKVLRNDGDNFSLVPDDDARSFVSFRVNTPVEIANRRVRSASHVRIQDKYSVPQCWTEDGGGVANQRPASAVPHSAIPPHPPSHHRRIRSAGVERQKTIAELRKGFTLVNKLYEDKFRRQNINLHPVSPAPDYRYFDRHSRCYDYNHMHGDLLRERPSTACGYYDACPGRSRPVSAASRSSVKSGRSSPDTQKQPKRYMNYHRPRTAPPTRGDSKPLPRANYVFRGRNPKFCNIVSQIQLHARETSSRPTTPHQEDSDYDDRDYLQKTFDANLIGRLRRNSAESVADEIIDDILSGIPKEEVVPPKIPAEPVKVQKEVVKKSGGTEGRPTTPSSIAEKDENPEPDDDVEISEQENPPPIENEIEAPPIMTPIVVVECKSESKKPRHLALDIQKATAKTPPPKDTNNETIPTKTEKVPPVVIPQSNDNFDDTSARDTPKQPPPTPEAVVAPKLPETPPPPKRRSCHTKKTKKTSERTRKPKAEMKKEEDIPKVETPPPPPPPVEEKIPEQKEIKVDLGLPDLPTYNKEEKQRQNKEQRKPERHLLVKTHEEKIPGPKELLEELQNNKHYEFSIDDIPADDTPKKLMSKLLPEFRGRLALSQRSARFELPMDMKVLETITAQDYIMQYCRISERRQRLYDKKFYEHKDKYNNVIPFEKLEKAMKEVLVDTITAENFKDMVDLLDIPKDAKITSDFFAALCALGERVLYPKFVTQETVDIAEYKREMIECADFCALDWKLHGVNVNPKTYKLLKQLS